MTTFDPIDQAIRALKQGEMIIVMDDDDRENEGDLIMAASLAKPEQLAFMVRHTSGIVCTPMPQTEAQRLHLTPMVAANDAPLGTAFTVSVDYRHGVTTGISAEERTTTVRALANNNAGPADFVRPGHIFPLIAREGGVLMRSGHTEAAVDLCRLADLPPVGVICELVNDDGTVKRGPDVAGFAKEHGLTLVSIADLIAWRQARERLVERVAQFPVTLEIGPAQGYAYTTRFDPIEHLVLVYGDIGDGQNVPTRLHRGNAIDDVFGPRTAIVQSLQRFKQDGRGVFVFLRDGSAGVPAIPLYSEPEETAPLVTGEETRSAEARREQWREIGVGAQILRDLGVSSIRLLASRPRNYVGLTGFGIEILETDIIEG
ncbi:MAG: 3,4-dihydroxy-2-butanone-4-phosphate synthase [Pseudomonadota bacterium]